MRNQVGMAAVLGLLVALAVGHDAALGQKRKVGALTITNNLTDNQNLLQVVIERKLPNGKVDSSRDSVTKGRTKTLTLPYGSYTVRLSRLKLSGGDLYEVSTTKQIEVSEANADHRITITERELSPSPRKGKG